MRRVKLPTQRMPLLRRYMQARWQKKDYELQIKNLRAAVRDHESSNCKDLLDQLSEHACERLDAPGVKYWCDEKEALTLTRDAVAALYRSVDEARESIYVNDEQSLVEWLWLLLNEYHAYLVDGEIRGLTERARTIVIKYEG